jgi:hypothetical protein
MLEAGLEQDEVRRMALEATQAAEDDRDTAESVEPGTDNDLRHRTCAGWKQS